MPAPGSRLKEVFGGALECAPGADRASYLARACGDDAALRRQVESLLGSFDEASRFLGSVPAAPPRGDSAGGDGSAGPDVVFGPPPGLGTTADAGATAGIEGPGSVIGPYKLLQQIGQGGMGTVYMAEQERPVRRKVALKLIRAGMDSAQVIARFEAERQALAMMDHAQIARVLDAGTTGSGRPYFVMELVRGVPITEYCDRNHLTPRERMELFLPVCRAIQHAHQKGIIHRDIKPSNVLVTLHDGVPEPKVIDFGVAKAVDQRLTDRTMFTEFGAIIGTLEYMSPEQAEMGALDIDTRSDIYSLGVLLYELLTGSTPLERARVRDAAYSEVLRRIREEEPPRPSTRLSGSKATLPTISAQRKTEPQRLSRLIRGELDWIVMKALEKDRTRRYETATGLARDIRRHLDGEAVEACPPSATYRLRKFARQNRTALATAVAFVALLVVSTVLSIGLTVWAMRAEKRASLNQARSDTNAGSAVDALERIVNVIRTTRELQVGAALAPLRAKLLAEPRSFFQSLYERLQQDRDGSPGSLALLGTASFELGEMSSDVGEKGTALHYFEQSLRIRQDLLARPLGGDRNLQADLARSEAKVGMVQVDLRHHRAALDAYERALAIRRPLAAAGPDQDTARADLAETLHAIGNLKVVLEHPDQALAAFEEALPIWRELASRDADGIRYLGDLTYCLRLIGKLRPDPDRQAEALQLYQRDRRRRDNPSKEELNSVWFMLDRAANQFLLATLQEEMGRPEAALKSFEEDRPLWQGLIDLDPSNTRYLRDMAQTERSVGDLKTHLGRPDEARAALLSSLARWEQLHRLLPNDREFGEGLAITLQSLARVDEAAGEVGGACARLRRALDLLRKQPSEPAPDAQAWRLRRDILAPLARAARRVGKGDEADDARRELDGLLASPPQP